MQSGIGANFRRTSCLVLNLSNTSQPKPLPAGRHRQFAELVKLRTAAERTQAPEGFLAGLVVRDHRGRWGRP